MHAIKPKQPGRTTAALTRMHIMLQMHAGLGAGVGSVDGLGMASAMQVACWVMGSQAQCLPCRVGCRQQGHSEGIWQLLAPACNRRMCFAAQCIRTIKGCGRPQ